MIQASALWLFLATGLAGLASASTTTVCVGSAEVPSGGVAEVTVDVTGGAGIACMEGMVRFDPAVVRVEEVQAGPLLEGTLSRFSTDREGRLPFTFATTASVKGEGTLIRIRLRAVGPGGGATALTLEGVRAWDDSPRQTELFVSVQGGTARVLASIPWAWIGGGALAVVLSVLLLSRRRSPTSPSPLPPASSCAKCGASLREAAKFCDACGTPRPTP